MNAIYVNIYNYKIWMNVLSRTPVRTMEHAITTMVHIFVLVMTDGREKIVEKVSCKS